MNEYRKYAAETDVANGLHYIDETTGAVIPPIQPSTTFARRPDYQLISDRHSYARDENPTYEAAEAMLQRMEGAADAALFSSGMAAAMSIFQALKPGDHIVVPAVMYWGLRGWLVEFCETWGLDLSLWDAARDGPLEGCVRPGQTQLVWIETPCNPTWDVIDIAAAAESENHAMVIKNGRIVFDRTAEGAGLARAAE